MNLLNLETYHTAAQIEAFQEPARLERVRQRRAAHPADSHPSHVVGQVGMLLNQARAWLNGVPTVGTTEAGASNVLPDMATCRASSAPCTP
jgi:malate synthase